MQTDITTNCGYKLFCKMERKKKIKGGILHKDLIRIWFDSWQIHLFLQESRSLSPLFVAHIYFLLNWGSSCMLIGVAFMMG